MTIGHLTAFLETLAPPRWAAEWDRVGLQLGRPDREVSRVVLALDVNLATLHRALLDGAQLIITHHPLLFHPLTEIRTDTPRGLLISELLRAELAVYAAHTNLDCAPRVGPAAVLAERLGLREVRPLQPCPGEAQLKLVTFLPPEAVPAVRRALAEAGAGIIGAYRECAYQTPGEGHFRALPGTHPAVTGPSGGTGVSPVSAVGTCLGGTGVSPVLGRGDTGETPVPPEGIPEARLEMILPVAAREAALAALRSAHPYEEPAVDLYPLVAAASEAGLGRVGRLPAPLSAEDLARLVAAALDVPRVALAGEGTIETVALLPGAGGDAVPAARAAGAQALVTGELDYHETTDAVAAGLTVLAAGHAESEAPLLPALAAALREQFGEDLQITVEFPAPTWRWGS